MKVADLIAARQPNWIELEQLCQKMGKPSMMPADVHRFSALYRAACADLALAEANQLPPNTLVYLHRLVARAHNQLYRSQKYRWQHWIDVIFVTTPRRIFHDPCVHIATIIFWGLFGLSAFLAYQDARWPGFCEKVLGQDTMDMMKNMHSGSQNGYGSIVANSSAFGGYVWHNAGIGLSCFVSMLGVLPGLITLAFNATYLGAAFGYMFRPEVGDSSINFQRFVTAHGPFELTAVVLSAGAGLRIGIGWIRTNGLTRLDSLLKNDREALPISMTGMLLFCLAAIIEGFISPEPSIPWAAKGGISLTTSFALLFFFIILGFPQSDKVESEDW